MKEFQEGSGSVKARAEYLDLDRFLSMFPPAWLVGVPPPVVVCPCDWPESRHMANIPSSLPAGAELRLRSGQLKPAVSQPSAETALTSPDLVLRS